MILPPDLGLDVARAVLTWLIWDQSRGRAPWEHPGVGPRLVYRLPEEIPTMVSPYDRWLLKSLLTTEEAEDNSLPVTLSVGVQMVTLDDWLWAERGWTRDRDGHPRGIAQVSGLQVLDRETGEEMDIVCPMCGTSKMLILEFDDHLTWASCPSGHATWHVPGMGRTEWEQWAAEHAEGEEHSGDAPL